MQNNQSSYSFWSWVVAIALALILLWMYMTDKGPSDDCCVETDVATETMHEAAPAVTEAFSFTATEDEFVSHGDVSSINWAGESVDTLKAILAGGITAEGDDSIIVLSGTVDSDDIKQQKGLDAQAFFGPDATIDNQISVIANAVEASPIQHVDMAEPIPVAKLYFDTGVHRLPPDSANTLEPVIAWLNENLGAIAVISGYHDATGDFSSNQALAKKRAESAYNALLAAGVEENRIEMRKPESTEGDGDLKEARRVEVSVE